MRPEIGVVHTQIERADRDAVDALASLSVSTIHEAQAKTGLLDTVIRPVWPGARLCGTAVTVLLQPGDNWMLHVAVEQLQPGDVIVAACTTACTDGFLGDLLCTSMQAHGCVGAVIDAGARDVAELKEMGFPVFSRAIHSQGTIKARLGSVNVPIVCAGAVVEPGDVVIGDVDGVVVVPRDQAAAVARAAADREANEVAKRERFRAGELGLDMYDMRGELEAKGLRYVP